MRDNERLPALLYRGAVSAEGKLAAGRFEQLSADHSWPPQWRDTIFDYHHYHSTAHEALGVFAGFATLMLRGPDGRVVAVHAGDALVRPVGTDHCRIADSEDFEVVGAYPRGMEGDIGTDAPDRDARTCMRDLPRPGSITVTGRHGPVDASVDG